MTNLKSRFKFSILSRIIIISFIVTTILSFLWSNEEQNFYNIRTLSYLELYIQILILILIAGVFLIFDWTKKINYLSLFICFFMLVFLMFFTIFAPVFSLAVGATLFAIPVTYFSFSYLMKIRKHHFNLDYLISIINLLLFLVILVITIIKKDINFIEYSGLNLSKISAATIITAEREIYINISIITMVLILFVFLFVQKDKIPGRFKKDVNLAVTIGVSILVIAEVVYLSLVMVLRTKSLQAPTFDFGLFTQMFYNMKHFNGMVTTLERSVPLSHMAVHVSPIYYLVLPVFMIFPYPETLQIAQVVIVSLGLIPLYLISKEFKFSSLVTGLIMIIYIFHPALTTGSFFDFHENSFLPPLLLFVLYFLIKQNTLGLTISATLTMLVKEDASIYLFFIGLYAIFGHGSTLENHDRKKANLKYGLSLIVFSSLYFLIVTTLLQQLGQGAMFWRYSGLNAYPEIGAFGIIVSVFQNPSYLLATMFTPDRMYYMLIILLVMGLLPLFSKNLGNYFLFAPLVLFNFSATYLNQYYFGFQYYFGTTTLLIFMIMLVFKDKLIEENDIDVDKQKNMAWFIGPFAMVAIVGMAFLALMSYNFDSYFNYQERNDSMRETLISIPRDKKVLTTIYLTTYLADRDVLYDVQFYELDTSTIVFDYIILDKRMDYYVIENYKNKAIADGYELSDLSTEYIYILEPLPG